MTSIIDRIAGRPASRRRRLQLSGETTVPVIVMGRAANGQVRVHLARTGPTQTMLVPASALRD